MTDDRNKKKNDRAPIIWGTVYDDYKRPLSGRQIRLMQSLKGCDSCFFMVGQTYSDCNGNYKIPIPLPCVGKYRIEVCNTQKEPVQRRRQSNICYY